MLIVVRLREINVKSQGREEDRHAYYTLTRDLLWVLLHVSAQSRSIYCSIDFCMDTATRQPLATQQSSISKKVYISRPMNMWATSSSSTRSLYSDVDALIT